ncbi:MAG: DUF2232 domain-containing protein [Alphaproteobacteria bacterium]|nr:DUF2232 domain-containing protein [Alphaproteobacteria bacterium]
MPVEIALVVVAGLVSGATMIVGGIIGVVLGFFAPLPLFLVGLSRGYISAAVATLAGTGLVLAFGPSTITALQYALAFGAPTVWLCRLALLSRPLASGAEWYPSGRLLLWTVAFPAAAFLALYVAFFDAEGGLKGTIARLLARMLEVLASLPIQTPPPEMLAEFFPPMTALTWLTIVVGNGLAAQAIARQLGRNVRPGFALAEFTLPRWLLAPLIATLALTFFPGNAGFLGRTLAILLLVPYFFLGLALVHSFAARWRGRVGVFIAFYLALFFFGWPALLVAALGIANQLMGLRKQDHGS